MQATVPPAPHAHERVRAELVERWFGDITRQAIRRGSFRSTLAFGKAIKESLRVRNEEPKPFVWTKSADEILESVKSY